MQRELFWDWAGWLAREYMWAIWGEVGGRILVKAGGEIGGRTWKRREKRMDGADKERDKKRDGGVKAAKGGHCWCWNQRLEVKSFENKSNLHHCSTELSDAFHLAPFKTFPPPHQPILSSKLTTPFHGPQMEKKNAFKGVGRKRPDLYWFTLILIPLFFSFKIPCRFKPPPSLSSFCNHHTTTQISANILSVWFPASFPPCIF